MALIDGMLRKLEEEAVRRGGWASPGSSPPVWPGPQSGEHRGAHPRARPQHRDSEEGCYHSYHHRGQLTVYLRELGVPIPSIYGPSADQNPFA